MTPLDEHRARVAFEATIEVRGLAGVLAGAPFRLQTGREGAKLLSDLAHFVEHGEPSPRKLRRLARASRILPGVGPARGSRVS